LTRSFAAGYGFASMLAQRIAALSLALSRLCVLPPSSWPRDAVLILAAYWFVRTWEPPPRVRAALPLLFGSWLLTVYALAQLPWTLTALRGSP
jgi:hypothetical protein